MDLRRMEAAILGGAVLGGGGGGSMEGGLALARAALEAGVVELVPAESLPAGALVATAALVGAPANPDAFVAPEDYVRAGRLLAEMAPGPVAAWISCENGGTATANGWLQAASLGARVADAPADGRAHPTSAMGALGLDREEGFESVQALAGGCRAAGRRIEAQLRGPLAAVNTLVRSASETAGGLVAVARNPVPAGRLLAHAACGAIAQAIAVGEALEGARTGGLAGVESALTALLGARLQGRGRIEGLARRTQAGFDIGSARVAGLELAIWNEYMTLERGGRRLATFPDLIVTLSSETWLPITSAELVEGAAVAVFSAPASALRLGSGVTEAANLEVVERAIGKPLLPGRV